jgi:hypothetical protein
LIRGDRKRSRLERLAATRRRGYLRRLRKRYRRGPGEQVLEWAKAQIGTTESPDGSNWGPQIGEWIKFTGYTWASVKSSVYWCGCFACYAVVKVGGAKIPTRIRLGFAGYIIADAKAGVNGLTAVPFQNARAGDLVTFWGGEHIGVVEKVDGDTLYTIEGNTSSADGGSQSNGGGVFARQRKRSDVDVIARPSY